MFTLIYIYTLIYFKEFLCRFHIDRGGMGGKGRPFLLITLRKSSKNVMDNGFPDRTSLNWISSRTSALLFLNSMNAGSSLSGAVTIVTERKKRMVKNRRHHFRLALTLVPPLIL